MTTYDLIWPFFFHFFFNFFFFLNIFNFFNRIWLVGIKKNVSRCLLLGIIVIKSANKQISGTVYIHPNLMYQEQFYFAMFILCNERNSIKIDQRMSIDQLVIVAKHKHVNKMLMTQTIITVATPTMVLMTR